MIALEYSINGVLPPAALTLGKKRPLGKPLEQGRNIEAQNTDISHRKFAIVKRGSSNQHTPSFTRSISAPTAQTNNDKPNEERPSRLKRRKTERVISIR